MVLGGCIYGCNRTKFGRIRSGPRLRVAPSTSGEAQWAVDRPCDGGRLGCVGRVGPTSPLTGPTGLLNLPALATLARHREPMRRAFHELFREQTLARRHATTGVVCLGRDAVARVLCGHLDALDLGAESEGRGDDQTTLRVSDDRCKPGGRAPCRFFMCGWEKAPQKAGPQYILHEGVPAKGSPS